MKMAGATRPFSLLHEPQAGFPAAWGKVPACEFDGLMATGVVNDE